MAASGAADKGFHLDEALLVQFVKRVHITVIGPPGIDFNVFFVLVKKQLHRTIPHILQGNIKILILLVPVDHEMFFVPAVHIDADIVEAIKDQAPGIPERNLINTDILHSACSWYTHMFPPFIKLKRII